MELLAPAGSKEALIAAVQSGADAVYIGGTRFSARQSADNFNAAEMKEWVDYCHLRGVKVYAAVNTLIKEKEISELTEYAYELNRIGVDAVIIQDIGAAQIFKQAVPQLPLHASTQMTVHNLAGVQYLADMGFERVVLSRELSREDVEYICRNSNCEIEVFVHGALCVSYSGQCLMSSIIGGRSGNRGFCAQPCRLSYELLRKSNTVNRGHLLSTKDLALIDELRVLKDIGVKSLKIEGRLKRAEYVAAVTGIYRKYIDTEKAVSNEDRNSLLNAFNRSGLTKAYFGHQTGKKMMSVSTPGNVGDNIFGDDLKKRCRRDANFRLVGVHIGAVLKRQSALQVTMVDSDGNFVCVAGDVLAEDAVNLALDENRLKEQVTKLGGTVFFAEQVQVEIDEGISLPVSEINRVRRDAVQMLADKRIAVPERLSYPILPKEYVKKEQCVIELTAQVHTAEQAKAAVKGGIKRIFARRELIGRIKSMSEDVEIVTVLPETELDSDGTREMVDVGAVEVHYPWQALLHQGKKIYGSHRLNIFNSFSADFYSAFEEVTVSPELNLNEIKGLSKNTAVPLELIAYGRIPLMLVQNCPVKTSGVCAGGKDIFSLRDRRREEFPIMCSEGCVAKLLNSKPIFMADKIGDLKSLKIKSLRLIFTVENFGECDKIINMYKCALSSGGEDAHLPDNSFTRGHYYRGVK
ncbi:MAG: DUF3656 domain-containing protein [Clostridia bacterium]|nr:DUF3656 domain-containing protein [Clostridia bacterium]